MNVAIIFPQFHVFAWLWAPAKSFEKKLKIGQDAAIKRCQREMAMMA